MVEGNRLPSAVEKQLECPVCLLKFRTPKLLECMHTFCEECVINVSKHSRLGGITIRCPTCRQKTKVVDVSKLHNNYIVQGIIDTIALTEKKKSFGSGEFSSSISANPDGNENEVGDATSSASETSVFMEVEESLISGNQQIVNVNTSSTRSMETCSQLNTSATTATGFSTFGPEATNGGNVQFNLTPSFNFGELDKTSFAPRTNNTPVNSTKPVGGYDFSAFSSAPTISFGSSLEKTSFSPPATNSSNRSCNNNTGRLLWATNMVECIARNADSPFNNVNVNNLSISWGSFEKTSFA